VKITGVEVLPVAQRLLVVVDTDEGIYGLGESAMAREHQGVAGLLRDVEPLVLGADPFDSERLWQVLSRAMFFPARRLLSSLIAAIDIALWDIKGKALGVPVYRLLGGKVRDRVPAYAHIEAKGRTDDTERLVKRCEAAVAEGWRYVRWGLPTDGSVVDPVHSVRTTVEQFAAIRDAVGYDIELIIDVHTRLNAADSVRLCHEIEPYRPYFVEDPLRAENPASYEMLRQRTTVPLAAGEQYASKWEFRELVEREFIDYARIDLCIAGGITESRKIAAMCETHYIDIAVHNPLGPVSTAAAAHFNISCPNVAVQEQGERPGTALTDVIAGQIDWVAGNLIVSDRPGLGLELDREAARQFSVGGPIPPRFVRRDGGVANW
jgi:galactonate dehydratase